MPYCLELQTKLSLNDFRHYIKSKIMDSRTTAKYLGFFAVVVILLSLLGGRYGYNALTAPLFNLAKDAYHSASQQLVIELGKRNGMDLTISKADTYYTTDHQVVTCGSVSSEDKGEQRFVIRDGAYAVLSGEIESLDGNHDLHYEHTSPDFQKNWNRWCVQAPKKIQRRLEHWDFSQPKYILKES